MIAVSNDFKNAMKQPIKELQAYIRADEVNITDADDLQNFKISCSSGMCKTAMRKLEAKYIGEHNLIGKWVSVGFGVKLANGTYEYLEYGSFLVTEITTTKETGVTTITGYDKMVNAMVEYKTLEVEYPINLYDYTVALCGACGLELGNESLPTMGDFSITQELWENIDGITYRDILVQIAQATASTCIIGNDDKIYFKPITQTGETLTYDNMLKLKLEPKYGEINSVVLSRTPAEDNIYKRDEDSIGVNGLTEFKIENNEIIDKDRDVAMESLYPALKGISYYPFETTTEGLGWYEIGDSFTIINDTGDEFNTTLFNLSITLDGSVKEILKTQADTKTQTQYQYASTIAKRVKNTEIIVDKQGQSIEELVTDMYEEDGVINQNFTKVHQDINNIVNNVQKSGGNNLIKNSVMFAYDDNGKPNEWNITSNSKNLFNINGDINTRYDGAIIDYNSIVNGNLRATCNGSRHFATGQKIYVGAGNTVTISGKLVGLSTNEPTTESALIAVCNDNSTENQGFVNLGSNDIGKVSSFQFTPLTDYIIVCFAVKGSIVTYADFTDIQVEYGDLTPFTPYDEGSLIIDTNTESMSVGALSGHSFTLLNRYARQTVPVKKDDSTISEPNKTYYTFSTRIKKATTGNCFIRIYNSVEEYFIEVPVGEQVYYKEYELTVLPKDTYYTFEFYGSADSMATFTDNMLVVGNYKTQWTQANGEVMNTQVNINLDGVLVKSSIYLGDYTVMSPLEFAGYSKINGTITRVFSLNKDTTIVRKLKAEDEVKMTPIKIVPVISGSLQGWAFVPSTEE